MNTILQQSLEVDKEAKIKRLIKYYNLFYKMQRMSLEVEWDYYMEYVKSENQILEIYRNFFKRDNSDEKVIRETCDVITVFSNSDT